MTLAAPVGWAVTMQANEFRKLCDMDAGVISPRIYVDDDIYREELNRIFDRA